MNSSIGWLCMLPNEHREDHVREAVYGRCRAERIEPPSTGRIDRFVCSAFHAFEERWCAAVLERVGPTTQNALDELLVTGPAEDGTGEQTESRRSVLNELEAGAGATGCGLGFPLQIEAAEP